METDRETTVLCPPITPDIIYPNDYAALPLPRVVPECPRVRGLRVALAVLFIIAVLCLAVPLLTTTTVYAPPDAVRHDVNGAFRTLPTEVAR